MRTIKFRALKDDMSNCRFMYGDLVYDAIGDPMIVQIDYSRNGLIFNSCIRGTEGQFTGIFDDDGVEIYEGDTIEARYTPNYEFKLYEVKYVCSHFVLYRKDPNPQFGYEQLPLLAANMDDIKVIGNIHENPELL